MKGALIPAFGANRRDMNFEFVAVSDIWSRRREEGVPYIEKITGFLVDEFHHLKNAASESRGSDVKKLEIQSAKKESRSA